MYLSKFFDKFVGTSLTYDDLIFLPQYVDFSIMSIELKTKLTGNIELQLPLVSAPMDTVTEARLAIALALQGGMGFIHYNMSAEEQKKQIQTVKDFSLALNKETGEYTSIDLSTQYPNATLDATNKLRVGAAIETWKDKAEERIKAIQNLVDVIVFDAAQGYNRYELDLIQWTKEHYPTLQVIGGNVVTPEACEALMDAGVDGVRVGMGSGSICTTQEVGGVGRGQATAVYECALACHERNIPVIADGGIKSSSDIVKALCLGASSVMCGSLFAGTKESLGEDVIRNGTPYKQYRGMGSLEAMKNGSATRYGISNTSIKVPEGVQGKIEVKGSIAEFVPVLIQGVCQGLHKLGHKDIHSLHKKMKDGMLLVEMRSEASKREGNIHSIQEVMIHKMETIYKGVTQSTQTRQTTTSTKA